MASVYHSSGALIADSWFSQIETFAKNIPKVHVVRLRKCAMSIRISVYYIFGYIRFDLREHTLEIIFKKGPQVYEQNKFV